MSSPRDAPYGASRNAPFGNAAWSSTHSYIVFKSLCTQESSPRDAPYGASRTALFVQQCVRRDTPYGASRTTRWSSAYCYVVFKPLCTRVSSPRDAPYGASRNALLGNAA